MWRQVLEEAKGVTAVIAMIVATFSVSIVVGAIALALAFNFFESIRGL